MKARQRIADAAAKINDACTEETKDLNSGQAERLVKVIMANENKIKELEKKEQTPECKTKIALLKKQNQGYKNGTMTDVEPTTETEENETEFVKDALSSTEAFGLLQKAAKVYLDKEEQLYAKIRKDPDNKQKYLAEMKKLKSENERYAAKINSQMRDSMRTSDARSIIRDAAAKIK